MRLKGSKLKKQKNSRDKLNFNFNSFTSVFLFPPLTENHRKSQPVDVTLALTLAVMTHRIFCGLLLCSYKIKMQFELITLNHISEVKGEFSRARGL